MAKKLKKKNTGMNPKVKFTLVNAGKGIISNQAIIDGSKESPWWVAAIFLAVSVLLPLIPNYVKINKTSGSDFISSNTYGFDTAISEVAYNMKSNGEDFIIKGGTLHYCQYEAGEPVEHDDWAFVTPDDSYFDTVQQESKVIDSSTGQFALRIFLWRGLSSAKLSSYKDKITKQQFARGTTNLKDKDNDPEGTKYYVPSLMFLTPKTFVIEIYKNNGTTQASTTYGGMDWARFNKTGLIERMVKDAVKDGEIVFDGTQKNTYIHNYRSQTLKQFKNICNVAYENQKTRIKWANTGIYAGIYTGIILFLGLMIFVLTRGKNNPFKYLNIWHTQKIAWWAAFTPAVLGMILAFVFSGNMIGQMAFILLVSLRTMWMSMKQLRPQYQQQ